MLNKKLFMEVSIIGIIALIMGLFVGLAALDNENEELQSYLDRLDSNFECEDVFKKGFCRDVYIDLKMRDALNISNLAECNCKLKIEPEEK